MALNGKKGPGAESAGASFAALRRAVCRSFPLGRPYAATVILRGTAFSTLGKVNRSTPSVSLASIFS